jgi:hypothetical protein
MIESYPTYKDGKTTYEHKLKPIKDSLLKQDYHPCSVCYVSQLNPNCKGFANCKSRNIHFIKTKSKQYYK